MQILSTELRDRFRAKPASSILIAILAVTAAVLMGEVAVGFIDGLIAGFTDGV